ncbi:MAG: hypothetical protein Q7U36_02700 [bacterium]|nr:hypothetical protein [bacterium]
MKFATYPAVTRKLVPANENRIVFKLSFQELKRKRARDSEKLFIIHNDLFFFPSHNTTFCGHTLFSYKNLIASIFDKKGVSQECEVVQLVSFSSFYSL